jgi:phosphomannomutase
MQITSTLPAAPALRYVGSAMSTASFLDHTPTALAFGTSGLRGLVKDITDLEAYINVSGALRYLLACGDIKGGDRVVLAGDLRPSTDRIMRACARAVVDAACQVENAGKIPTPALMAHCLASGRAGVMVTGSHIPFDRNGIKINKSVGEVLKTDEAGITREVERVRAAEYGKTAETSAFDAAGMWKRPSSLPPIDRGGEEGYVRRFVGSFAPGGLSGLRVLVYQHSAVGRDLLPRILRELGADVCTASRSETFVPIDTENIAEEELDRLEALATAAEGDGPLDAIVSTDGDSDRPLVIAVLPAAEIGARGRRVRFLSGDLLGIVVAEYLRADAAAVPISSNDAVERRMAERGVVLCTTRIGSPYVVAALNEMRSAGAYTRIVGWEANGGFLTQSDIPLAAGTLAALPTRDSTLPILANLFAAKEQRVGLAALWSRLPARFGRAGLCDNVPVAVSRAILARLMPADGSVEVTFEAAGRVHGGGEPAAAAAPLAGAVAAAWLERRATLSRFFTQARGFGDIVRINVLDGVRIFFKSGDVAHVRPSGNAPQLRIYACSDSQARADKIVALALEEPEGILRQMVSAFTG